nr:fibrous sheath CABYR-binding protein-like [Drosophila kikkawai]
MPTAFIPPTTRFDEPRALQISATTEANQKMDGQGHPPTPAPAPQDTAWMYCAVDELLQALHGAGPSQPRPGGSLAGPFRPRALPVEVITIDADNTEEANTGNHAGPRRPSTEGMPPLASQHTSPIGPSLLPLEVAHHRGDDEEGVNPDDHAGLRPSSARGMPPLVPLRIGLIGPQRAPLEAPLRTGHIGPQAPPPEVAPPNGNDEKEVPPDNRFGPPRVDLTPPQRREAPSGDPAPAAEAEDAWNQAVSLSDDWVNFDRLVEDTLGDLFDTIEDTDEAAIGLFQRGPPHAKPPATGSLGPLGARYDLVTDGEDSSVGTRRNYNPTGEDDDDSDATVIYNPTAEDSRDIRRRRTTPPHPSTRRTPPYMGEVEAALIDRDPRPRLPTIAELAAEEARRRAQDLSEELGIPQIAQPPADNTPPTNNPRSADNPPPATPRRRARRRSAPCADSPSSSSDESSLDTDEGALNPPRLVPAPAEWTTPNGTLPAALLRRIHGRLAVPRRRTIRVLEEEGNQRFRV